MEFIPKKDEQKEGGNAAPCEEGQHVALDIVQYSYKAPDKARSFLDMPEIPSFAHAVCIGML